MAGWSLRSFKGIAPKVSPLLLQDNQAQTAENCKLWNGMMRPVNSNEQVLASLPKTGTVKTIYRFGQDVADDEQYWFHWTTDVDVCRGQIFDDVTERTFYTDGVLPKVTNNAIALTGGTEYPMNSYTLGVPAPTACVPSVSGTGTGTVETRYYTYTFVSAWGEEGRPAPPSAELSYTPGQTITVGDLDVAPTGNYNITSKRIYRTSSVGDSSVWLFVAEIAVATTSYVDTVATVDLGEELPSNTYHMPPSGMEGLVNMANGMMAGFYGREICFCEPYIPHAWPVSYRQTVDYKVVALGALDTTLVVLTTGFPFVIQGTDPSGMAVVKIDEPQACVSKRSVRVVSGSVVYASPDGLYAISSSGPPVNLTANLFGNTEWRNTFNPSSINAYVYDGKYIGFYDTGTAQGGFIIDPATGDMTTLSFYATAGFYDPMRDALFLVVGGALVKFDQGATALTAKWKTKKFYSPKPINCSSIRVEAASYPVSVKVYADGTLKGTFSITSQYAQRLPSGFSAKVWEVEITSAVDVYSVSFAESMEELANG